MSGRKRRRASTTRASAMMTSCSALCSFGSLRISRRVSSRVYTRSGARRAGPWPKDGVPARARRTAAARSRGRSDLERLGEVVELDLERLQVVARASGVGGKALGDLLDAFGQALGEIAVLLEQ